MIRTLVFAIISRIPGLREWIGRRIFIGPNNSTHRLWGVFPSFSEAKAHIPKEFIEGPDEKKAYWDFEAKVRDNDMPAVRILAGLMTETKTVFDLGGNIGLCFYQFRSHIPYPADLRWTISDLPAVNEFGRKVALERREPQLVFTDNWADASGTDVFLSTGTLQYLEKSLAQIVSELKEKPNHLLINRVPMTEERTFYTLQNSGHNIVPYCYANRLGFIEEVEAVGYKLIETWKFGRGSEIILRPDVEVQKYYGFYFKRD